MKWTERGKDRWTAKLGSGLNLHVYKSQDADDVRRDFTWVIEVFGQRFSDNYRAIENAKEAAENQAREVIKSACAECGLKVVEGE